MTQSPYICCAGEVMVELAAQSDATLYRRGVAGDSFNTAVYLARAGLPVDYLTCLGDDALSDDIVSRLQEEGVGCDQIRRLEKRQPGIYLILNDDTGERQFSYWRSHSPARELFDQRIELPQITVFYFTGITLAVCRSGIDNLLALLSNLRQRGARVIFDPNYRPALWDSREQAQALCRQVLPLCDWVMTTLDDDAKLWGIDDVESCQLFYHKAGVDELVIKAPDLTAHAFGHGEHAVKSATQVLAVDTTGAGDSFNAGYLASRLRGGSMKEAITAAQSLSAKVVQHRGAILPKT